MPREIILNVVAQKGMNWNGVKIREAKILFEDGINWHVSSPDRSEQAMRTINNQLFNTIIFE